MALAPPSNASVPTTRQVVGKILPVDHPEIERTMAMPQAENLVFGIRHFSIPDHLWPDANPHCILIMKADIRSRTLGYNFESPSPDEVGAVYTSPTPQRVPGKDAYFASRLIFSEIFLGATFVDKIQFFIELSEAVESLHRALVVSFPNKPQAYHAHKDLHPANILISDWGNGRRYRVMLIDLGADDLGQFNPIWAAPEQLDHTRHNEIGPQADIFPIGRLLVTAFGDGLSEQPSLQRLAFKCLSDRPEDRPTAAELAKKLHRIKHPETPNLSKVLALTALLALLFVSLWIRKKPPTLFEERYASDGVKQLQKLKKNALSHPDMKDDVLAELDAVILHPQAWPELKRNTVLTKSEIYHHFDMELPALYLRKPITYFTGPRPFLLLGDAHVSFGRPFASGHIFLGASPSAMMRRDPAIEFTLENIALSSRTTHRVPISDFYGPLPRVPHFFVTQERVLLFNLLEHIAYSAEYKIEKSVTPTIYIKGVVSFDTIQACLDVLARKTHVFSVDHVNQRILYDSEPNPGVVYQLYYFPYLYHDNKPLFPMLEFQASFNSAALLFDDDRVKELLIDNTPSTRPPSLFWDDQLIDFVKRATLPGGDAPAGFTLTIVKKGTGDQWLIAQDLTASR